MAEVVNLNRYRKARKRAADDQRSSANRVKHGRNKTESARDDVGDRRQRSDLDGKRLDEPPNSE